MAGSKKTKKLYISAIVVDGSALYLKKDGGTTNVMTDPDVRRYATKKSAELNAEKLAKSKKKKFSSAPTSFVAEVEVELVEIVVKDHEDYNNENPEEKKKHPHMIGASIGKKHISHSITHGKGYVLEINPLNPDDPNYGEEENGEKKLSHLRRDATVDIKKAYSNERVGYLTDNDFAAAQTMVEKSKANAKASAKQQKKKKSSS